MRYADSYVDCCPPDPPPEPTEDQYRRAEDRVAAKLDGATKCDWLCGSDEFGPLFEQFASHLFASNPLARQYVLDHLAERVEGEAQEVAAEDRARARRGWAA